MLNWIWLALIVIGFYLWRRGKPLFFVAIPLFFMLLIPAWAMIDDAFIGSRGKSFLDQNNWLLVGIATATLALEGWMMVEAALIFPRIRGVLEPPAPDPRPASLDIEAPGIVP